MSAKQKLQDILHHDPMFSGLQDAAKAQLLQQAQYKRYLPQQQVLQQAQYVDRLYILLSGSLQVGWLQPQGEHKIYDVWKQHSAFNLVALLQKKPLNYDYVAMNRVEIAMLPAQLFLNLLQAEPQAMWQVLMLLSQRMYQSFEHHRYQHTANLTQRVAWHLLKMYRNHADAQHGLILERISQQQFAERLNVSRQTLNKHLQYFIQQQWIEWQYSQIRILDLKALEQVSHVN